MARGSSVWLVVAMDNTPLAAFSVRHECHSWFQQFDESERRRMRVFRMKDNPGGRIFTGDGWIPGSRSVDPLREEIWE